MSTNEQEQWLQMIGAELLRQQLEQLEQQPTPMTQAQHSWTIAADRNRLAQDRMIEAARERQRQRDKERAKAQAQQQEQEAERIERETKAQALQEWVQAGNLPAAFEGQWKQQYLDIMQARVEQGNAQAKAKFAARYGF